MENTKATPVIASTLTVGSIIMPPAREMRLWMRRGIAERNLPESVLRLKVTEIYEGAADKRGPWLIVVAVMPDEWYGVGGVYPWKIKMRPDTMWPVVSLAPVTLAAAS